MKVGVVGLGTMGAGIAQVSVTGGHDTVGREVSMELAERGRATIERYLARAVEKGKLSGEERDGALGRLTLTTEVSELAECDLVIEAIVEELGAKRELFAELDRITRPDAVLATNTSALSVTEIASATEHPERVVGMHFFNPAPVLPLVEIVRAERSSDDAVRIAYDWAERAGKQPVNCRDTPGFIVNRILIPQRRRLADGALRARRPGRHRRARPRVRSAARTARRGPDDAARPARTDAGRGEARPQERRRLLQVLRARLRGFAELGDGRVELDDLAPDRVRSLLGEEVERDGVHRRDRRCLEEAGDSRRRRAGALEDGRELLEPG